MKITRDTVQYQNGITVWLHLSLNKRSKGIYLQTDRETH